MSNDGPIAIEQDIITLNCVFCKEEREVKRQFTGLFSGSIVLLNGDREIHGKLVCCKCINLKKIKGLTTSFL